jgi:hypothetical protein
MGCLFNVAVRGVSRFPDLFLDPEQVPGTFSGDFAVGALKGRFRAETPGLAKTSEEIG